MEAYRQSLKSVEVLTRSEITRLHGIMQAGDPESALLAKNRLIESALRLVFKIAVRFVCPGHDLGDLIGEGNLAAIRAVDDFDPARGEFITLVRTYVQNELSHVVKTGLVRLPPHTLRQLKKIDPRDGVSEVMKKFNVCNRRAREIVSAAHVSRMQISDDLEDAAEKNNSDDPPPCLADVDGVLASTPERQAMVHQFYGIGGKKKTAAEISKERGLETKTVEADIREAIKSVRERLTGERKRSRKKGNPSRKKALESI